MGHERLEVEFEGKRINISVTPTVLATWGVIGRDNIVLALKQIGLAILGNYDYSKPLKEEFLFDSNNTESSLDRTLDWLRRNAKNMWQ